MRGAAVHVAATVTVPGKLTLGVDVARSARAGDGSGFVVLTRGGETRRFPYWFRVSVPRLGSEGRTLLRRPGVYRGNTRGRPARVSSYRYPSAPGPLGVTQRLAGPEQVFRFIVRGRVANAGAVVVSEAPGSHVSPRLVRAGNEDRLAGYTGAAAAAEPVPAGLLRADSRPSASSGPRPVPTTSSSTPPAAARPGASPSASGSTTRARPSARLLTRTVARGKLLLLRVSDRGSGVDPSTLLALVDGSYRRVVWDKAHGLVGVRIPTLARGSHKLVFTVSDYQEAKNNENASATLPNTRTLTTTFAVR